jgi:hypothetical protein
MTIAGVAIVPTLLSFQKRIDKAIHSGRGVCWWIDSPANGVAVARRGVYFFAFATGGMDFR